MVVDTLSIGATLSRSQVKVSTSSVRAASLDGPSTLAVALDQFAKRFTLAAMLAILGVAGAHAQSTLGDVLDKGGVKITQAEWLSMLPHKNFGFGQKSQNRTEVTFAADGNLVGKEQLWDSGSYDYRNANSAVSSRELKGTWKMDPDGKICINQVFGKYENVYQGCFFMFRLGDNIFHVDPASDSDRRAAVTRRRIESVQPQ